MNPGLLNRNAFCYFARETHTDMKETKRPTLEEHYDQIMKNANLYPGNQTQGKEEDRFKSILYPDYSEYTTSTITASIC